VQQFTCGELAEPLLRFSIEGKNRVFALQKVLRSYSMHPKEKLERGTREFRKYQLTIFKRRGRNE
jgi:hypothetical protein